MNSKQINVNDSVSMPQYFYLNSKDSGTGDNTFKKTFDTAIDSSCSGIDNTVSVITAKDNSKLTDGSYAKLMYDSIKKNNADEATALAAAGLLQDTGTTMDSTSSKLQNQVKYLACQVAQMHAREYNSDAFPQKAGLSNLKEIFTKFITLKPYLIIIFFLSMFMFFQGLFSSLDVGYNVSANLFRGDTGSNISYWAGLLFGIAIPFLIILSIFSDEICKGLKRQNHYDITNNPFGTKEAPSTQEKNMDYMMIALFILFIYGFIGVLYTIGSMDKNLNGMILFLVTTVMGILAFFIYIFYMYTPYLASTGNEGTSGKLNRPFSLYVFKVDDVDNINSNQNDDKGTKKVFQISAVIIYILAMLYFKVQQNNIGQNSWFGSIIKGMTGAGAILVLPIIWVVNTIFAIKFFYIYPVFLILARGIRYFTTLLIYGALQTRGLGDRLREAFSEEYLDSMSSNEMKNYSPSWGLIGISLLKTWMNMCGFDNKFSKEIVEESNSQKDLSQNKYTASFILGRMLIKDDRNGMDMKYTITILVLTVLVSSVLLFGVEKVQNIK